MRFQRTGPIRLLLNRKYGKSPVDFALRRLEDPNCLPDARGEPAPEIVEKIQTEYAALKAQSQEQLKKSFAVEEALSAAEDERERSFSKENAPADFQYWARASFWTIDEGIALILGRDPRKATTKSIKACVNISEFARRYVELLELARRAASMNQILATNLPGFFIAWAKRSRLEIDPELEAALEAFGVEVCDWKSIVDTQKETIDALNEALATQTTLAEELTGQRDALNQRLVELQNAPPALDPLGQKERTSLLKLVIAMAVEGYRFDPTKTRNAATREIADDLALLGIALDSGTILKWLNEGAALLPRELEDD